MASEVKRYLALTLRTEGMGFVPEHPTRPYGAYEVVLATDYDDLEAENRAVKNHAKIINDRLDARDKYIDKLEAAARRWWKWARGNLRAWQNTNRWMREAEAGNLELDAAVTTLREERDWYHDRLAEAESLLRELAQNSGWLLGDSEHISVLLDNVDAFLNHKENT